MSRAVFRRWSSSFFPRAGQAHCCWFLVVAALVLPSSSFAQQSASPAAGVPAPAAPKAEPSPPTVGLADLVPKATALAESKAKLEEKLLPTLKGVGPLQAELEAIRERLVAQADRLEALKSSGNYGFDQVAEVKGASRLASDGLQQIVDRAAQRLTELEAAKKEWGDEKARWQEWKGTLGKDSAAAALAPTFAEAFKTIAAAQALLQGTETPVVEFQRKVAELKTAAQNLGAEADVLLQAMKGDLFRKDRPSLLSAKFYAQFHAGLWEDLRASVKALTLPSRAFFSTQGWIPVLQLVLSLGLALGIRRHGREVGDSERWRFLLRRPFSAGFFAGVSALSPLYGEVPALWRLLLWTAAGVGAARLGAGLVRLPWRRRLLYLLAGLFLVSQLFSFMGLPTPLFRAYVALVGLGGAALCWWRANENRRRVGSLPYIYALRLGSVVLAGVFAAQTGGYSGLASHLLDASIKTTFLLLFAWMFALLAKGGIEFVLGHPLAQRSPIVRKHAVLLQRRWGAVIDAFVVFLSLAAVLEVWRFYDTVAHAASSLLALGFAVGEKRVTVGLVLLAVGVLYGALFASWLLQRVLDEEVYPRRRVEPGVGISINRLIQYAFVLLGFLLAVSVLGVELQNFTILAGAFGIGIGFGLQNIVSNFVSGLILLFERPIKVGDIVQVEGEWGHVRKVGLRATVVGTLDESEVIVPNSDLITGKVTNWTLSDKMSRLVIPVGVAYGSDVPLVMRLVLESATENPLVLPDPAPQIFFTSFGNSSLDFELRAWVGDINLRFPVRSEIHQAIDRKFRASGVEIPFPQTDLHLRTVDERARGALARVVRGTPEASG